MAAKEGKLKNGIFKRGSSWYINVEIKGKRYRKSFGRDKRAAELAIAELRKQSLLGRATGNWAGLTDLVGGQKPQKTFAEVAADYMDERPNLAASTKRSYAEILKNRLIPEFGDSLLNEITEERISKFQARIAGQVSPTRANNIMGLLRYILKVCVRRKLITENPASDVKALTEDKPDIDPLTREELDAVIACLHPHYKPLFLCLAWTGARPNELLALRWSDVDLARGEIHIRKGRVRGEEGKTKTPSSKRTLSMLSPVKDALLELEARPIKHVGGYVFLTKKGVPIDKHVDRQWRVACRKAGVRHRPSYHLRHTWASYCLQNGADPGWVSKMLGHSTLEITFRHYARFINTAAHENQRRIEATFGGVDKLRTDSEVR